MTKSYPWYTPYQFAGNKPINSIDLDGLEEWRSIGGSVFGPYSSQGDAMNSRIFGKTYLEIINSKFEIEQNHSFTKDQIMKAKDYIYENYRNNILGKSYHSCTDCHKNVIKKVLGNPEDLVLRKDQSLKGDSREGYEGRGESSTQNVRSSTISQGFALPSMKYLVKSEDGKLILNRDGSPGNGDAASFQISPSQDILNYVGDSEGYFVIIGAFDDDYHSFSIILDNTDPSDPRFHTADQFEYLNLLGGATPEEFDEHSINGVNKYHNDKYPAFLELYILKNNNEGDQNN